MSDLNKCPFCGSDEVYYVRHDRDWGGGNSFSKGGTVLDLDIETNYCHSCESFGDFEKIFKLINNKRS